MKAKIDPTQVHYLKEPLFDAGDNVVGEKDVLQFDVKFLEHPELPTYNLRVDAPITRDKVIEAIKTKWQEVEIQRKADEAIKALLGAEFLESEIEV